MSAVMSTLSIISGGRRAHRKLAATSCRKSGQFSDAGEDRSRTSHELKQQRSASLQTLETTPAGGLLHLDTLEAKMASIEVSLAGARRRGCAERGRDLDVLRAALNDKDALIESLKKQLNDSSGVGEPEKPSAEQRRVLEERAAALRTDLERRAALVAHLRKRLDRTPVTDNIDSRIRQAELQYRLGREELELQSVSQRARDLHALLRQPHTLYSAVREGGGAGWLFSVELRPGTWSVAARAAGGLVLQRTDTADVAARPGDRLVEVNGASVLTGCQEELQQALRAGGTARVVLLRSHSGADMWRAAAERAELAGEQLRADNTRLTHRISYLEEQVAELQGAQVAARGLQLFRKGPGVTALVNDHQPGPEPRDSPSGASERAPPSPRGSPASRRRARYSLSRQCLRADLDCDAETDAALRLIRRNRRAIEGRRERTVSGPTDSDAEVGAGEGPLSGLKKTNWAERKTLSIIEQIERSRHYGTPGRLESSSLIDGKVLHNAHKSGRRRSRRSTDLESEGSERAGDGRRSKCSDRPDGECDGRPAPPRKPLRLSLHKSRSAHSLPSCEPDDREASSKKPVKRTHARPPSREAPTVPGRATPRPVRKALLPSAVDSDALYPATHHHW